MSTEVTENTEVKLPEGWLPTLVTTVRPITATYQRTKPQQMIDDLVRQSADEPDENLDTRAVDQILREHVPTVEGMIRNGVSTLSRARKRQGLRTLRVIIEERDSEWTMDDGTPLVQLAFRVLETRPKGAGESGDENDEEVTEETTYDGSGEE